MKFLITGTEAIRLAKRDNLTLYKLNDVTDNSIEIKLSEAIVVAKEDPDLIYIYVEPRGWHGRGEETLVGYFYADYFSEDGAYLGPNEFGIEPTFADTNKNMKFEEA